jgi:hypothetical protein
MNVVYDSLWDNDVIKFLDLFQTLFLELGELLILTIKLNERTGSVEGIIPWLYESCLVSLLCVL